MAEHPMNKYPLRLRRFFNNFMMSKGHYDYNTNLNWDSDLKLYGFKLPGFYVCEKWFKVYGLASEEKDNKSGT